MKKTPRKTSTEKKKAAAAEVHTSGAAVPTMVELVAAAIANARAGRRGAPMITNVLEFLPAKLRAEVLDDAAAVLAVLGNSAGAGIVAGMAVPPEGLPAFVSTWDELAARLGTTRKAIQNWRTDPRYAPEIARRKDLLERADGRHCVAEWLKLMVDLRLKRGKVAAEAQDDPETGDDEEKGLIQPPRYGGREADWTKANKAKEYEKRDIEVGTIKGSLLEAAELEVPIGATFAAIQTKLSQFPARVARYLVGLRDLGEVEDRLRDEIDADLGDLNSAKFTAANAVGQAVAAVPFDAWTEELCEKLLFAGSDRAALLQLAAAIATEALRLLGKNVLQQAVHAQTIPDTAIADEFTGQVTDEAADREHAQRVGPASGSGEASSSVEPELVHPAKVTGTGLSSRAGSPKGESQPRKKGSRARPKPTEGPAEREAMIAPGKPVRKKRGR